MRPILRLLGMLTAAAGLLLTLYPFWSVASLTDQVLDEAPAIEGTQVDEDRHALSALWKSDFELAQRTYRAGVTAEDAIAALGDGFQTGGFTSGSFAGAGVRSKTCCGDYDAVIVKTQTGDDGLVTQSFTVFDADIQFAYVLVVGMGLVLMFLGLMLVTASTDSSSRDRAVEGELIDA